MGGISAGYTRPIGNGFDLSTNITLARETNAYSSAANEPAASTGGWTRLDARIALGMRSGFEVYAYGRNLTDEQYPAYASRSAVNVVTGAISRPRLYGLDAIYRY